MKKQILAALALVALVSCAKESGTTDTTDSSDPVAATFSGAAITRVANNAWEATDQIGITMTESGETTLADGNYYNVPHTVKAASDKGTFTPDDEVIYFPVDGSTVDFYAYYPCSTLTDDKYSVNVATQSPHSAIDLIAATALGKSKSAPAVTFADDEAFEHQLSLLTINISKGDGISSLSGLKVTIYNRHTTAKYDIFSSEFSDLGDKKGVTAITSSTGTSSSAVLIPFTTISGSYIVFALGDDDYVWDTSSLVLEQGKEHTYSVTVTKTEIIVSGAEISEWSDGADGTGTAE